MYQHIKIFFLTNYLFSFLKEYWQKIYPVFFPCLFRYLDINNKIPMWSCMHCSRSTLHRWNLDILKLDLQDYFCRLDIQRLVWIDLDCQDLVSVDLVLYRSILWRSSLCWSSLCRCDPYRSSLCKSHPSSF